ncbi:MAG: deoxynucleoside kinase [Candidatus Eisenbacteria bacterium]|uniref:Deoxynucleoside kinase n=1 Tax=Eiseniibacteriota bacterium TaxID=2212470 RepID=A0A956N878_UNCEI|nr:deoxynucleoside kinase [Candidatus Eisenbacteria bacterium]MCB9463058.1 deoxynucleoside kinase [Candidatus Eisenbacteria bacterium]
MATGKFLAIEGVIGVGKTTLTRVLAERTGGTTVLEAVEENPFLASFYEDRRRFAFQTQLFFLLSRYRQQMALVQRDLFANAVVSDYLFQKDRIFASINLADAEMELYDQILPLLERDLPRPDRVVYLRADLAVLLSRIEKRGRPFEKRIDPDYLETLREAYDYFFFHYQDAPLLVVNTNEIDVVGNEEHREQLVNRILQHDKGTAYYNPA